MPSPAFVMSVSAPLVAAGLRILLPATFGAAIDLVWLLGLVPVFVLPRHLGWRGEAYAIGWIALLVVLVSLGVALRDGVAVDWTRVGAVVVVVAACGLGAGLQLQWLRGQLAGAPTPSAAVREAKALPGTGVVSVLLDKYFAAARRHPPFAVALFEIDDLRARRNLGGEAAVERAFAAAEAALRADSRSADVVGRWGESRFLVLLPGADLRGAHRFGRRVFEALTEQEAPPEGRIRLNGGVAAIDDAVATAGDLVHRAERAVDAAHGIGGGALVLFRGSSSVGFVEPGMTVMEPDGRLREIHRAV
jgi:diguanylate cyclase (GGDEF)-like protein